MTHDLSTYCFPPSMLTCIQMFFGTTLLLHWWRKLVYKLRFFLFYSLKYWHHIIYNSCGTFPSPNNHLLYCGSYSSAHLVFPLFHFLTRYSIRPWSLPHMVVFNNSFTSHNCTLIWSVLNSLLIPPSWQWHSVRWILTRSFYLLFQPAFSQLQRSFHPWLISLFLLVLACYLQTCRTA